jgi:succinate dehydrogenase/fumarate reductase flavoprotein subunit
VNDHYLAAQEPVIIVGAGPAGCTAAHEDGRLVVTVTSADPGRVCDAVAGFALTVRSRPSPAPQPPRSDPQRGI